MATMQYVYYFESICSHALALLCLILLCLLSISLPAQEKIKWENREPAFFLYTDLP